MAVTALEVPYHPRHLSPTAIATGGSWFRYAFWPSEYPSQRYSGGVRRSGRSDSSGLRPAFSRSRGDASDARELDRQWRVSSP